MAREISPEERLLSLIKDKKKKPGEAAGKKPPEEAAGPAEARSAFSKADERISGMLKGDLFRNKLFEPAALKAVNRYLLIILALLVLYFFADLVIVRPYRNVQALISKASSAYGEKAAAGFAAEKDAAAVKDYPAYSPGRTLFGPPTGGPAASEEAAGGVSETVGLVGIIAGDNPQAIIEDKKAQKTYYLNKGQTFNGYVVEDIGDGKVTLDYEGRKISLFL